MWAEGQPEIQNPEEINLEIDADQDGNEEADMQENDPTKEDFEPDVIIGQKEIPTAVFGAAGLESQGLGAKERLKRRKLESAQ